MYNLSRRIPLFVRNPATIRLFKLVLRQDTVQSPISLLMLKVNFRLFYVPTNVQQINQLTVHYAAHQENLEDDWQVRQFVQMEPS